MADDPYVYPGTDVLRNRLDIRDAADLAEREAALSAIRIAQLERRFIPGGHDLAHLQATHRHIFGDVYPWAGELRTVQHDFYVVTQRIVGLDRKLAELGVEPVARQRRRVARQRSCVARSATAHKP